MVRWALVLDLMLLSGVPLFSLYNAPAPVAKSGASLRLLAVAAASIGMMLSVLGVLILAAMMSGVALRDTDLASVASVVTATAVGTAFLVRMAALAMALALGLLWHKECAATSLTALLGTVALGSLAWSGHGVMDDGRTGVVHLVADIIHLLAAAIWVGALASLGVLLFSKSRDSAADSHDALAGFASAGSVSVALVLASGLINSWLLVGPQNFWSLGSSLYGRLLLMKLALFVVMLALASINRFRLTPGLAAATTSPNAAKVVNQLRLSLMMEMLAAVIILGLVAWLGTLEPPVAIM